MNPRPIWFRRKRYGWGWYPSTWQGWAILAGWIVLFVCGEIAFIRRLQTNHSFELILMFIAYVALLVTGLLVISYRYGESPRWQWGEKNSSEM